MRIPAILCAALMLMGSRCTENVRECPTTPVIVEVPTPVRQPVPAELTAPIDSAMCASEGPTVGDIRRQRAQACAAISVCNARLEEIGNGD